MVFQVIVGILFLVIGSVNINKDDNHRSAVILNDLVVVFIFAISVINIIISSFGIQHIDLAILPNNSNATIANFMGKWKSQLFVLIEHIKNQKERYCDFKKKRKNTVHGLFQGLFFLSSVFTWGKEDFAQRNPKLLEELKINKQVK